MNDKCLCKKQLIDKKKSTYNKKVYRNCKMKAVNDGYCNVHNPEIVRTAHEQSCMNDLMNDLRQIEQVEETAVGRYLRLTDARGFDRILKTLNAMTAMEGGLRKLARVRRDDV